MRGDFSVSAAFNVSSRDKVVVESDSVNVLILSLDTFYKVYEIYIMRNALHDQKKLFFSSCTHNFVISYLLCSVRKYLFLFVAHIIFVFPKLLCFSNSCA